jgi:DNA-directed RNA polymerase subunit omega
MARITVEDCLSKVGSENRFSLIHLALARLRQHRNGLPYLLEGKNKEVVMTLREIAAGLVTPGNIKQFAEKARQQAKPEPTPEPIVAKVEPAVEAVAPVTEEVEPAVEAGAPVIEVEEA